LSSTDTPDSNGKSLLKVSDLTVSYGVDGFKIKALDGVSLDIPGRGYTLGLVGESGSGKTTLGLSMLNLLEPPALIETGRVEFYGKNVFDLKKSAMRKYRWQEVSMVYQSAMNSLNPVKRITEPIIEVLRVHSGMSKYEAHQQAISLLLDVGIKKERINAFPHELSGGMKQRVVIALALALSPKLLIADEPTSALDVVVQKQILTLLKKRIQEKDLSLVFITHEISLLTDLVQNTAVMYRGEIVEIGQHNDIASEPLHPYTEMLFGSLLSMSSSYGELSSSVGKVGGPRSEGLTADSECRYADRCKYAFDRCRKEKPKLLEVRKGRWVACHKYN
jgi:oligopeptide/dipeptide ABC transporter ATP-binding protein